MKGKRDCPRCGGLGTYDEPGDAHRSAGRVPCYHDPDLKKTPVMLNTNVFKVPCNCDASCGENRSHELGSPGCRYFRKEEIVNTVKPNPPPKKDNIDLIQIPSDVDLKKPEEWKMVLDVDKAIKINEDLNKLKEDNARMKKALNRIITESEDADMIRLALIGLDYDSN